MVYNATDESSNLLKLHKKIIKRNVKMIVQNSELDNIIQKMKLEEPNLFQIMADYMSGKLSKQELETFFNMDQKERWAYIDSYQAR